MTATQCARPDRAPPYPAGPADAEVMAAIHAAAFPAWDAWDAKVFREQVAQPGVLALLHPSGGMIVARLAADEAEILTLAVIPDSRRTGIAATLLQAASCQLAERGARACFLEVSVRNEAALALYTNAGFTRAGLRRDYYSDTSDALVLRLDF
jgi:ribosomal-protein-alanine N-acetyltransferase